MTKEEILKRKLEVSKILFINSVPVDKAKIIGEFIENLEQENQQLKEQLQHKYNNFPKTVKNLSKEELESLYLDLLHVENEKSKQLQQRDEVIDETINKIEDIRMEKWSIIGTDIMLILDILNKGRGSHEN